MSKITNEQKYKTIEERANAYFEKVSCDKCGGERYVSTECIKFRGGVPELKFELCTNCSVDLINHIKKFFEKGATNGK